ncbi:hydrolase TatD [bacterium]|nr:hydrolase TatD [bacterium]|tara:strand:+ start:39 stop:785 length:747 start_codon:yes stop_codon:yes gene_type:complete
MIDTHAHLFYLKNPLKDVIEKAKKAGVTHIINVAIDIKSGKQALKQAGQYPEFISATMGVHPCDVAGFSDFKTLKKELSTGKYVAVGEIGLDYYHMATSKEEQIACFKKQLDLAREFKLPAIIHSRESDDDMKAILREYQDVKKVLHCFSSSAEFALSVINKNTYFSFTGMITLAKRGKVINAIKQLPIEHIMIETDCPYMNPIGIKGDNEPANVSLILDKIAELKPVERIKLKQILEITSRKFFKLL